MGDSSSLLCAIISTMTEIEIRLKFHRERYHLGGRGEIIPHSRLKLDAMIACKEMVESLIEEPVNLGLDGKVTIGF